MSRLLRLAVAGLVAFVAAVTVAAAGASAAPAPRTSLNDVESEVMCVSCGVPLNIAESPQADDERRAINELVRQGKTKEQIKQELVATYGDRVLALPKSKGFGLVAYLVPIFLALLALAALAVLLPRWRDNKRNGPPSGPGLNGNGNGAAAVSAADARRLEEDLARYDV
ncbi:MAG: cytochrome c-type biosis protein CcmH [Baekduia sp.]|nr:cytochrome c-type biosis protein CcmH [Baekduia sp.]